MTPGDNIRERAVASPTRRARLTLPWGAQLPVSSDGRLLPQRARRAAKERSGSSAPAQAPASATGRSSGDPAAVIHTRDLTKVYVEAADFAAVDKLNLDVMTGEIFESARTQRRREDDNGRDAHDRGWCSRPRGSALLAGIDVAEPIRRWPSSSAGSSTQQNTRWTGSSLQSGRTCTFSTGRTVRHRRAGVPADSRASCWSSSSCPGGRRHRFTRCPAAWPSG